MKILELGKYYPPYKGGMETLLRSYCRGFASAGHNVRCLVANDQGGTVRDKVDGIQLVRLRQFGTFLSVSLSPQYIREALRMEADIWHVHQPNPLADLACLLNRSKAKLIITYHSDIIRQSAVMGVYGFVLKAVLRRAWKIVVATPAHLKHSPWLQTVKHKVECIPFGIDLSGYQESRVDQSLVAQFKREKGKRKVVLNVGRLVSYKGQSDLVRAMLKLDGIAWIIGSGPLEESLKREAEHLGVSDRVQFLGEVSDAELRARMYAADVFALPSITRNEAFGIVQVEAMACGKPVVSTDIPSGVPYVNRHGETGLIVPPNDATSLAGAIKTLFQEDDKRERMGKAARERALREYDEPVMIERYLKLFQQAESAS